MRIAEGQGSNNRILAAFQKYVQMLMSIRLEMSLFEETAQSNPTFEWSISMESCMSINRLMQIKC